MCFAKSSVAVHWCWLTAHLYEEQTSIGVNALPQACCEPELHLSTEERILPTPVLQFTGVGSLHTCMKSKSPYV